jgi:hypothetical protein
MRGYRSTSMRPAHPSDDGPVLDAHVTCVRCRYDLAGTHVLGKCPECGLEVLATVAAHGDPDVAHLAAPEAPRAASAAVVAVTVAPLVALLLQGSGPAMRTVDALVGRGSSFPSQVERPSWLVTALALGAAAVVFARGFSAQANPTLRASVGAVRVRRLAGALWAWAAVLAAAFVLSFSTLGTAWSFSYAVLAAQMLPCGWLLVALAPVLGRAGALSRAYREARHGKQGAELVSLTAVAANTLYVAGPAIDAALGGDWATVGMGLAATLFFLTALGLAYLVGNGWVIATALRRPRIDPSRLR